jgi:hypothetical protein
MVARERTLEQPKTGTQTQRSDSPLNLLSECNFEAKPDWTASGIITHAIPELHLSHSSFVTLSSGGIRAAIK